VPAGEEVLTMPIQKIEDRIEADFELTAAARLLSGEHGDVYGRREAERAMASSPRASWLYKVRRIQCAVTAANALQDATVPAADLWVPWLRVCSGADRRHEAVFPHWRAIEECLLDSVFAVEKSRDADEIRRWLVPLPVEQRRELIRDENGESCDYLVACVCLAQEEDHRDVGDLATAWTAVWIADALVEKHRRLLRVDESTARKLVPSILTDLLVLAWARLANVLRIRGELQEAHSVMRNALVVAQEVELSPYVEAELASLHASLLKDEGLDLAMAEERIEHAIEVFATFDQHLAARAGLKLAEIQRQQGKADYLARLRQAIDDLDAYRDSDLVEAARNNLLYYLAKEDKLDEAIDLRYELARPNNSAHRASRLCAEGYLDLKLKCLDAAARWLPESAQRFTELHRPGDAMIALLYLAAVCATRGDLRETRDHLTTGRHFARSGGYCVADAIDGLLDGMDSADDLPSKILDVASQAEGCLDPREPVEAEV
jgi:hypothetical protein